MKLFNFITLAALAALEVFAAPPFHQSLSAESSRLRRRIPDTHIQHEKRAAVQERSWTKLQRAVPDAILPMRIGLKQQNLRSGHDLLMDMCGGSYPICFSKIANKIPKIKP